MFAKQNGLDKGIVGQKLCELAGELSDFVQQAAVDGRPLHEVERPVLDRVLRIGHSAVELFLRCQGNGDLGESVSTNDGQTLHRSEEPATRPLRTVFGLHTITAFVYSAGVHEEIAFRPVDARLQLPPGRASYLFEEFSQYFCVEQAFGKAADTIEMVLHQKVSVDSLEHINHRVGDQAAAFLPSLPTPPAKDEGELLVFTGDGKGVPMVKEDARLFAAFDHDDQRRPGNRRMATLAGVYSVDRHIRTPESVVAALFRDEDEEASDTVKKSKRPPPKFKHIRGSFMRIYDANTEDELVLSGTTEAFYWADLEISRRLKPEQTLVRLMDGQASLWNASAECLRSAPAERTVDILDILHVSQYVWRAAKAFYGSQEQREAFARDRLLRILQGEVSGVISGLRQIATKHGVRGRSRKEVETVCRYFKNNTHRMKYDEYLRAGYPIASGVIEGACRHFVKDRMERSGMRWRMAGAQAMLDVRSVYLSTYWDDFHRSRIVAEQRTLHPHRKLLKNYTPVVNNYESFGLAA